VTITNNSNVICGRKVTMAVSHVAILGAFETTGI